MALTEDQMEMAMRYVARRMIADGVDLNNVGAVVQWMIANPLPKRAIYESEVAAQDEEERQLRIQQLREEIELFIKSVPQSLSQ